MNDNKSLRIWKWAVMLLILCNIGLVITIWVKPHLGTGNRSETPRDFVIRNLKFSDEQVKQYDALITVHRNSMDQLKKESREYRQQLFGNLKNNGGGINPDSIAQLIANNQKQIEVATYRHFAQVRTICTDQQKVTFDQIIDNVTKMMSGPRGGPRRDNREGPPPEDRQGHEGPPPNDRPGND